MASYEFIRMIRSFQDIRMLEPLFTQNYIFFYEPFENSGTAFDGEEELIRIAFKQLNSIYVK